jgi:hypothetical protein
MIGGASTATVALYSVPSDGALSYASDGRTNFDARNITFRQERVSAWVDKTLAGWSFTQVTAGSQPFYCNSSYAAAGLINSLPAIGNLDQNAETMTIATGFGSIWTGADVPASLVGLFNRIDNPGGTTSTFLLAGTGSTRQALARYTTGGYAPQRTDDAGLVLTPTVYGAPSTGVQTVSEVFTGNEASMWCNGVQLGATKALDAGTCTFNTTTALNFRVKTARGFAVANRALTTAERTALENGFKRRAGLI